MAKIEERILTMRFDNAQFKAAAKDTTKVLSDLKGSLKMDGVKSGLEGIGSAATKSLGGINKDVKNVDLSPINNGIEEVKRGMTALEAVSLGAFASIGAAAVTKVFSKIKGSIGMITNPIVTGGMNRARNLEQANFMLGGIVESAEEVELIMKNANTAVTGTAYGLDQAAKAAAQFAASGKRGGQEMENALRGISGVAAMTNSEYDDIASVFTTVAGNGRLMASELNRISARGVNAAAALATSMGITEGEVRELTSEGKISFDQFAEAMNDAFGEQATKANETYSGSLSNLRAALGRIGADVAIVYLAKMRDLFNELRPAVNAIHKVLGPFIAMLNDRFTKSVDSAIRPIKEFSSQLEQFNATGSAGTSGWTRFFKLMQDIGMIAGLVGDVVRDAVGVIFGQTPRFIEMSDTVTATGTKIQHIFRKLLSVFMLGPEIIGHVIRAVLGLGESTGSFGGNILDLVDQFASFLYLTAEWIRESTVLQSVINGIAWVIRRLITVASGVVKVFVGIFGVVGKLLTFMSPAFYGILTIISKAKEAVTGFLDSFTSFKSGVISKIATSISRWFGGIKDAVEDFDIDKIWKAFRSFKLPKLNLDEFKILGSIINTLKDAFGDLRGFLGGFMGGVDFSPLTNIFTKMQMPNLGEVSSMAAGIGSGIKSGMSNLSIDPLKNFAANVKKNIAGVLTYLRGVDYAGVWATTKSVFVTGASAVRDTMLEFGTWIVDAVQKIDWSAVGNFLLDGLISAVKMVATAADAVADFISDMFSKAVGAVDMDAIIEGVTGFGDKIKDGFTDVVDIFKDKKITPPDTSDLTNTLAVIPDDITVSVKKDLDNKTKGIRETVGDFFSALFGKGDLITQGESELIDETKTFGDKVSSIAGLIKSPFATAKDAVNAEFTGFGATIQSAASSMLSGIKIDELMNGIGLAFAGAGIFKLGGAVEKLAEVPKAFNDALKSISTSIKSFGDAAVMEAKGNAILKIAASVAILAGAIWFLSKIPHEDLAVSLITVLSLLGALVGSVILMDKMITDEGAAKISSLAKSLMMVGLAVGILAAAIWILGNMDTDTILQGLGMVVASILALAGGAFLAGMAKSVAGLGFAFMGLALGVAILAGAFLIFKLVSWEDIEKGLATLAVALLSISIASAIAGGNKLAGAGVAMLGLGVGLLALSYGLKAIAALDEQQLNKGLTVLAGVMLGIGVMSRFGGNLAVTATALVGVSFALIALAYAIGLIADIDFWDAFGGMTVLVVGLGLMGLALRAFPKTMPAIAASLMGIAGALAILVAAIWIIGNMDLGTIVQGMGTLAVAIGGLVLAMRFMPPGAQGQMLAMSIGLLALSGSLLVFGVAMRTLQDIDWETMGKASLAIALLLLGLTGLGAVGAFIGTGLTALGIGLAAFGGGLLVIAGAAWVFADAVSKITDSMLSLADNGDKIKDSLGKVGEGITAFATEADEGLQNLFDIIGLTGTLKVGALAKLFTSFESIPENMDERFVHLTDGLMSLSTVLPTLETLQSISADNSGSLGKFFAAFSDITPDAGSNLQSLADTLSGLGVPFFNTLDLLSTVAPKEGKLGGNKLSKFFKSFNDIDPAAGENLMALADTLRGFDVSFFTTLDLLETVSPKEGKLGGNKLSKFFDSFNDIDPAAGEKLKSLADTLRGFDVSFFNTLDLLETISPKEGKLGGNKLSKFFESFNDVDPAAGEKLKSLADTLRGFDVSFFTTLDLLETVSPPEGPLGGNKLSAFFESFDGIDPEAGTKLKSLADTLRGFDVSFFNRLDLLSVYDFEGGGADGIADFFRKFNDISPEAGAGLASMADTLRGFDVSFFNTLDLLSTYKFEGSSGLASFFKSFEGIGEDTGTKLGSLVGTLKRFDEDFFAILTKLNNLETTEHEDKGLSKFFRAFDGINADTGVVLGSLVDTLKKFDETFFANMTRLASFSGDSTNFTTFLNSLTEGIGDDDGASMAGLASGIQKLSDAVPAFSDAITGLQGLNTDGLSAIMDNIDAAFSQGVGDGIAAAAEGISLAVDAMIAAATDRSGEFTTAGETLGGNLVSGVGTKTSDASTAGENLGNSAANGSRSARSAMVSAGVYIAGGLAQGIRNGKQDAVNAAKEMADAVAAASRVALKTASPSRVFIEIGQFVSQGFAVGITKDSGLATQAIANSMDDAIDITKSKTGELKNSTGSFYDGILNQLNNNPVTRRLEQLAKHSKAAHATAVKERKIEDQEKLEKAEEERKKIYNEVEESRKAIAEAKEETQTAKKETKKTEKSAEDAAKDSAKAAKDAQKQKEKITDAEERHQKALRERDKYEYRMHGEEAGVAFVDGVAVGLMDDTEAIPSVAEILAELLLEEVDTAKDKVSDYTDIFDGFGKVLKTTKSMGDNVKDLTRAFKRLDSATSPRSIRRNIEIIFDSIVGFGGGIQDLIGVLSIFEPFLPSLLGSFESSLPAIAAMVAPFAPQLAATLGGGLTAALPAIMVPAMGIIGAIAGIGLFLNDQANGGGLLKTLQKMFKGVIKFIVSIPKKILDVMQTMIKGLKQTIKDLPVILTTLIDGAVDLIVGLVDAIPEVIPALVDAIVEIMAWVILNAPLLVLEMGTALIMGLARGIDKGIRSMINLLLSPFAWLTGKIGGQLDLFKMAHEAVRGLMNGFAGALASMLLLIISPFVSLWNTIADIFGFNRLAVNSVEDFKNAIIIGMRNAVDAIAFPFIALWNFIMGLFGWEQLAYDTASSFIFGTEKGFSDREGAFKSSAERVTWLLTEALNEGTNRNINDTLKYIDEYMDLVSKGMVAGVSLGSEATRRVADDVWKDIESVFDMAGLGKDELKALTDAFYHGTTNPDTIVSSFGAVFERIEELLSTTETGPQMLTDLNDSLEEGLRKGLLDASMDGIAGLGKSTMAKLTDGMVSEMKLSREDISSAANSIWKDVEAVFDYYGLGKDGLDDLKKAYEEGTKNPETFASSFQSVFNGVRDELEMVGLGTEVVEGLENSMHTRVRDHLNPKLKQDFKGAKDAIANEMSPINGSSIGEGVVEGIISGILAIPQNILNAGGEVLNTFRTGIEAGFEGLIGLGGTLVGWVRDGIGGGLSLISTIGGSVWTNLRDGAEAGVDFLKSTGGKLIGWVRDGIGGGFTGMFSSGAGALGEFLKGLGGTLGILKDAGVNIIGGVLQGIMSGADWIKNEIVKHGQNAWNAFRSFFGIRSPSRLMAEAGKDIMQGLTMGIRENGDDVSEAMLGNGEDILAVTKTIVDEIAAAMALEEDFTITPVIDLSEVRKGVDEIGGLVSAQSMDVGSTMGQVNALASTMVKDRDGDTSEAKTVINNIEFNQTNTSPEPLSAYEIYQNTQRELTLLKLSGTKN